jgi:hypothetical protein
MKEFDFEPLKFEDSFVVFLDVLGFSVFVNSDNEEKLQKINFYFWIVEKYLKQLQEELEEINEESKDLGVSDDRLFKLDYILISDSIIITIRQIKYNFSDMNKVKFDSLDKYFNETNKLKKIKPVKEKQQESYLDIKEIVKLYNTLNKAGFEKLCGAIENIQKTLASQDVWLRGAITAGTTHISTNKKQIVGKAYIDAYKLESEAIYPRVVLDEKIIKELYYTDEEEFITSTAYMFHWGNTSIEKDIPLFIDYLRFSIAIPDNYEYVNTVLNNILMNYESSKEEDYYNKYSWLLEYIKTCLERGDKSYSDLLNKINNVNLKEQK